MRQTRSNINSTQTYAAQTMNSSHYITVWKTRHIKMLTSLFTVHRTAKHIRQRHRTQDSSHTHLLLYSQQRHILAIIIEKTFYIKLTAINHSIFKINIALAYVCGNGWSCQAPWAMCVWSKATLRPTHTNAHTLRLKSFSHL